jgi:hypothetical protein
MDSRAHVRRVVYLLVLAAAGALILQRLMRPEGFGELGHYRAGSLSEILARPAVYQGQGVCSECHADIFGVHEKDVHFRVECEDCHGPGDRHARFHREGGESPANESPASESPAKAADTGVALTKADATLPKEYTLEGCLFCHRQLASRPRDFPQIDPTAHYAFLHVKEPTTRCVECHSPHEPLYLLTRASDARLHPIIHECSDCHDKQPEVSHRDVEAHPAIFVCADCHRKVVEDFSEREHGFLRCTACHLFHKENDTAGRIYKNGNQRFCLLCHEEKPFKAEDEVPMIVSADHLRDMAKLKGVDPAVLQKDARACLSCHFEYIHGEDVVPPGETAEGGESEGGEADEP